MARPKSTANKNYLVKFDRSFPKERTIGLLRNELDRVADFYGFAKVYLSPIENNRFFIPLVKAGLLEEKQLVICKNRTGEIFLLRPSSALSFLRFYITNQMVDLPHPLKLMVEVEGFGWRKDKDSSGLTLRPEWSLFMVGEGGVVAEAEILHVIWRSLQESGIPPEKIEIRMNAWGCKDCQQGYRLALASYLRSRLARLCKNCKRNLRNNPTDIFLCQEEKCKIVTGNAPLNLDFLCDTCKRYLRELLEFLDEFKVSYFLDARFFRGRSYFNKMGWEIAGLRAKDAPVAEGGHGEKYVFGEGGGLSRAASILADRDTQVFSGTVFLDSLESFVFHEKIVLTGFLPPPRLFLIQLGMLAKRKSFGLLEELRKGGFSVAESLSKDAIKSQLKSAENLGTETSLILGQKEAIDKTVIVRDTQSGIQETIPQDKLVEFLNKKLKV